MKKLFTLTMLLLCAIVGAWAEEITIFSATPLQTLSSDVSFGANATTEISSSLATISGGKISYVNEQGSAKNGIRKNNNKYAFSLTNNNTYLKIELNTELAAGDIISVSPCTNGSGESNGRGVWVSTSTSRPGSAPDCALLAIADSKSYTKVSYTVKENDDICGATVFYAFRATANTTDLIDISIVRPVIDTRTSVSLSFPQNIYSVNLGETFSAPSITADPATASSEVVYSSSNTSVATINSSTGTVSILTEGSTTITASISGSEAYKDAEASYTLNITDPDKLVFGLTQADLTTSTGITTTSTYSGNLVTLAAANAAMGSSSSTRNLTNGTTTLTAAGTACQRNNLCSGASDFVEASYYAFSLNIASGYKINISQFASDFYYDNSRSGKYKFAVYSGDGNTKIWEAGSSDYVSTGGDKNSAKTLNTSSVDELKGLTGEIQVRMVWYQGGSSSYVALKDFNITANIEEDARVLYELTTIASPEEGGIISRSPAGSSFEEGTTVTLTATPNTGYYFVNWTNDANGEEVATTSEYTYTTTAADAAFTAHFAKYPVISFSKGETEALGTLPNETFTSNGEFTIPVNNSLYVAGKTLTAWSDGATEYPIGETINGIFSDVTLTPVFTNNTFALSDFSSATTVSFPFTLNGGAPVMNAEGSSKPNTMRVSQATEGSNFIDVLMSVDATNGKFNNNQGNPDNCQVNATTMITIPAISGMTVTINKLFWTSYLGEEWNVGVQESESTTWTYVGTDETVTLTIDESGTYPTLMTVVYPMSTSICSTPTIAVSDFSFEHKGYTVTISSAEGESLHVSTDGTNYSAQASPYVINVTAPTTFYAKATAVGKLESSIAEQEVTYSYDTGKKFIAWVYTSGYGSKGYAFATDPMVIELQKTYNVVEVNYSADTTPSTDLNNADLIVCTEAMTGNKTMSNGMKAFAGVTPMIGLKAFNYTKGRWSWGKPANPNPSAQAFTPKAIYKVLNGVNYESDGTIKLATASSGNVIQTVEFGTEGTTAPEGNTILGTLGDSDTQAVMYTSSKYFGLGLSSDCWDTYTANAVTIVKNAAAMLIAGEALDTEVPTISKHISAAGYATLCSEHPLVFVCSGLKAYIATVDSKTVTFTEVTSVPANTGVLLKGTEGDKTIAVAANSTDVSANQLVGVLTDTPVAAGIFVLRNETNGVGFYKTTNTFTVGANTAYLPASVAEGRAFIGFADEPETTGINEVKTMKASNDIYNLKGQRVEKAKKGLYIIGGKKVVMK